MAALKGSPQETLTVLHAQREVVFVVVGGLLAIRVSGLCVKSVLFMGARGVLRGEVKVIVGDEGEMGVLVFVGAGLLLATRELRLLQQFNEGQLRSLKQQHII